MRQLLPTSRRPLPQALSTIQAGSCSEISEYSRPVDINELVTRNREGFVLFEVSGDSMLDAIRPGYLVFVDTWIQPRNGDIVAADIDGLTCIKIFQSSAAGLYLIPANKKYVPRQIMPDEEFRVLGVVKGHLALYP